jgi:cell wall assembly regulator SMI1
MDDSMYPLDTVRPLARTLRSTAISWHDADHRLVQKFAEDMTMQEFIAAAEEQHDRTLRENARMMAAFMNHDGAGKQMTLGEILDRDQVWRGSRYGGADLSS